MEPLLIFDSHAHYDDRRFDQDRDTVLAQLPQHGVGGVLNAACDIASARESIRLAQQYEHVYCSVGIHPHEAKDAPDDLEQQLQSLARQPKVVALGEMGLDYHYDFSPRDRQQQVFERQLAVAVELDMPVIIHDREAHQDTMALLRKYRPQGIVHCFSGSAEMAVQLVELGFYIGFTGVVTFKNARKPLEAAQAVPIDRLLIETDCPYMAPEPFRGKRCDSTMLGNVAQAIGQVKGLDRDAVIRASWQNARRVYRLDR